MSFVGDKAELTAQKKILGQLPKGGEKLSIDVVRQRMCLLVESALMKFMGTGLSAMVTTVHAQVFSLHAGRCPKFLGGSETAFVKGVKIALGRLCTVGDMGATLFGQPALDALWKRVEGKGKKSVRDLRPLNMFSWMLEDAQRTLLRAWGDQVVDPNRSPSVVLPARAAAVVAF
jgi:hypothetical protein